MANKGFNGTTVTFPSTASTLGLRGVSYTESAAEVNVTGASDSVQKHVAGIPKKELSLDIVGGSTVTAGTTGSMTVNWNDGKTTTVGSVVVISKDIKGQMDGEITASLKVTRTST